MYLNFYFYEHFVFKITHNMMNDLVGLLNLLYLSCYRYLYSCEYKCIKIFAKVHFYVPAYFFLI